MYKPTLSHSGLVFLTLFVFFASACASSSLTQAVKNESIEEVRKHLSKGADVNEMDPEGNTPLHHAAREGYEVVAEILIGREANVNAKNKKMAFAQWSK